MAGRRTTPVKDCRRQGVGLYWSWRNQRDSTTNVRRGIPETLPRDVTTTADDVTQRLRGFRRGGDVGSRVELDRRPMDRNPPAGRRISRLDPLVHDLDQQPQQSPRLPRQRRRQRNLIGSLDVTNTSTRNLCTPCRSLMTSRTTIGDVPTSSRDYVISRSPDVVSRSPFVPPLTLLTPKPRRRRHRDPASWSKSNGADWDVSGLLESPGRMSCFQLELVEQQHSLSLMQVRVALSLCTHDDPQVGLHPRCAQGQGRGQRSRDTGTFVIS